MSSAFSLRSSTFAIIPVKTLRRSKSRLARALKAPVRAALTKSILSRTLDLLQQVDRITHTIVISNDITVLDLARSKQAIDLVESESGLNAAIKQAATWSVDRGAGSILIVPSDLPLITSADIESMLDLAVELRCVVIAPDRRGEGTNALLVRPPDAIDFAFGAASFHTHTSQSKDLGLAVHVYQSTTIGLDLDIPEDLERYQNSAALLDPLLLSK
ncbi:MAG TPA: 2-phospho-L-lactate guanylyltransferase [Anaerolineae bacterium]|nr:2-phospho-L-lactate guanylyltransferase [Anaerolineae bacterium]